MRALGEIKEALQKEFHPVNAWTTFITKRAAWVLATGILVAGLASATAFQIFGHLQSGGFDDPATSSARAKELIDSKFAKDRSDVLVLLETQQPIPSNDGARQAAATQLDHVRKTQGVAGVSSYFSTGSPAYLSRDGKATFASVQLSGNVKTQTATLHRLEQSVRGNGDVSVVYGGGVAADDQISAQIEADLAKAEALSFPVLAILLLVVFRSLVAALVPLVIGALSIVVAFLIVRLLTNVTDVSVYAINIITLMGLGLAIDYSLFIVSRFREELAKGSAVNAALAITMGTAGRTVLFSGLTVILSLLGLLVFPQSFLRSMGLGGAAAVASTALLALTILPAMLKLLGHRINGLAVPGLGRNLGSHSATGIWYRYSHAVMGYPLSSLVLSLGLLTMLGGVFLSAHFSTPNVTAVPKTFDSRIAYDKLTSRFDGANQAPVLVVAHVPSGTGTAEATRNLQYYVNDLSAIEGVKRVDVTGKTGSYFKLAVSDSYEPQSAAAKRVVNDVRSTTVPAGWEVESGGETAGLVDLLASLEAKLPWAGLIIVVATGTLLFLMLGSVVIPLKAILLNVLSLSAAFGLLVWLFQDGHFARELGLITNGTIDATQPVLIFAIAFGLAMDYEVFLLSRIKEEYDRTGDNAHSVAFGVQHTAGIITSAALMMVVVIGLFATGHISIIQQVGVGLAAAVAIDATVVRMVVVPAAMRVLGGFNWWAPGPLARLAKRLNLGETN